MSIALYSKSQILYHKEFVARFFGSTSDIIVTITNYTFILLCTILILYPLRILYKNTERTKRALIIKDNIMFFENLKPYGNSVYFELQFMINRLITAWILVYLTDYPSI